MKIYKPSKKILEKYADVMVNYAFNSGKGIKKGDVVMLQGSEATKPLFAEVYKMIIKKGGHVIPFYSISDPEYSLEKIYYKNSTSKQDTFFPEKFYKGLIDTIDHRLYLHAEEDSQLLKGIDSKKIMKRGETMKPWKKWCSEKENQGKYSWTICNYGTQGMADAAELSLSEYWNQIIKACYLRDADPVETWKGLQKQIQKNVKILNGLSIRKIHILGKDMDLEILLPKKGAWKAGSGANIPSFEIFTSPDWRGTNGWIRFNQPLYQYGNKIEGIYLEFKKGKVIKARATKNQQLLLDMIAIKNADKLGEFSLTDARFSKITKPMADTLYDENMGGKFGNTHIALGRSFRDAYQGNPADVSELEWESMGYNFSSVHTDIISTTDRTVTATLADGTEKIIYAKGQFLL
jgi:aminopeptidase